MPKATVTRASALGGLSLSMVLAASLPAAAQTTVNMLISHTDGRWEPVIEAFNEIYPDITIELQSVPFNDMITAIETRVGRGDSSIDLFYADTPRIAAKASRGYLLNLDDRREVIEAALDSERALNTLTYEGSIYAYPIWTTTGFLYYNKDLLDAAGIEYPSGAIEDRMTWGELLEDARAAQEGGATWGFIMEQVDRYYMLQPLFESAGGGSGLTGDDMLTADITNPAWIATGEWYGSLFESGLAPRGITASQTSDLFQRGEVAYYVSGPWSVGAFEAVEGLNYGVAPHPYFAGGKPVTATGSWALAVNPNAANLEAAQLFAEFATLTQEGAYLSASVVPNVPLQKDAFAQFATLFEPLEDKIGPAAELMAYELANTVIPRPTSVGYIVFETEMGRAFSDIRNGAPAAEVFEQTEARLQRLLARQR